MGIASFARMGKTTACKRTAWVLCGLALAATAAAGVIPWDRLEAFFKENLK